MGYKRLGYQGRKQMQRAGKRLRAGNSQRAGNRREGGREGGREGVQCIYKHALKI